MDNDRRMETLVLFDQLLSQVWQGFPFTEEQQALVKDLSSWAKSGANLCDDSHDVNRAIFSYAIGTGFFTKTTDSATLDQNWEGEADASVKTLKNMRSRLALPLESVQGILKSTTR